MVVKQVHRPITSNPPIGQILWYKEFKDHEIVLSKSISQWTLNILILVTEGRAEYSNKSRGTFSVKRGDAIFIISGEECLCKPDDKLSYTVLAFSGPVFDLWVDGNLIADESPILHLDDADKWKRRMLSIPIAEKSTPPNRDLIEVCRLQQLLCDLVIHQLPTEGESSADAFKLEVMHRIESIPYGELNLDSLSKSCGLSYDIFRKKFKRVFGVSPKKYHMRILMAKAESMLQSSSYSISELADALNFPTVYQFSHAFKRETGRSPLEYRQSVRNSFV